uniref:CDP-diacylglycerol--serine O-phosphatidyltransferase n=1 Tax=uncultured Alphaproteobacteria bacterium TaxID=91750 RepID=A0A6G8F2N5_9PROT|nr:CDP-diacylglycerol--serine O-phosphatidyltransferase [uncultured Alphaproteobacteria bacterium]
MENINSKLRLSKQKLTSLPIRKIIPNIVTTLAVCAGVTSIRYAMSGHFSKAIICIFLAALFDMLDGRVARMLKGSTKFGAELDSLSDFVSFGVAPAILMYKWTLFDFPKFGWFFCLLFAICMAMRLARFNTMLEDEPQPPYWNNFFTGVPAPAAAALGILPIMLSFEFKEYEFLRSNWFCSIVMFVVAMLMISRIPTISTKHMKVPTYMVVPLFVAVVFGATLVFSQPWLVLSSMVILYAVTIPLGVLWFLKGKKTYNTRI